jgi:hypothetical protein
MPIHIKFSPRDLKRGILVSPGWYRVKIDSVNTKRAKDNKSDNYVMEATIICNADDGSKEFEDVVLTWNFNEKAPGFTQGLFKALMNSDVLSPDERYDLESTAEKEVDVFVENGEWDGAIVNRVKHRYRYPKQG